ncbi:transcriptional regulator, GntR family [Longilinea arvoryzae]|uniref:Transcriptional regulator, GntR family n=1 Tax=Longilinea arvoryzae TaxID=360412 RepID=A0A0S7BDP3_9CHLR|nr:GntR family transcriptional regulator [Longilinea arvoryzae]GAP12884.1 transcriptional regulator, GntR family [Longilinea arvoryzae]
MPLSPLALDFRSGVPIYTQIVEQIQDRVWSGLLRPGDQLPTVRQLASELRVNFNTVARAYRILDEAGLISTQQGRGTYILEQPDPGASAALRQATLAGLTHRWLTDLAQLGYSPADATAEAARQIEDWKSGATPSEPEESRSNRS